MKEELKALKESAVQIIREKEDLKKQINFFNMKVAEKNELLGIEEIFNGKEDSYVAAGILNFLFPQIRDIVTSVKNEHPKYGEKRIKDITVAALNEIIVETDYLTSFKDQTDVIVDNYFLYANCGYFKLAEQELKIEGLEEGAKVSTDAILNQSKEAAIKAGASIANVVKPYGEVAKSQFEEAKVVAKSAINKGSKKLIKLLKNIEDKTKSE